MQAFVEGMTRLIAQFQARAGIDALILHRGANSTTLVRKAWTGRTAFRINDIANEVSRIEWSDRDFFIPVVDYKISGVRVLPDLGDWFEYDLPEPYGNQRFEISAPEGEQAWRHCDPMGMLYRIHTKRMLGTE